MSHDQLARRSRKAAGLDRHQRRRLLLGCSEATSHSERGRSTGIRIRHDLLRFGLLHSHRRSSSDTNLPTEAGSFPSARRAAIPPSPFARGRSFPPGDRPPLLRAVGQRRWIGWAWGLESTSVGSPVVEHKTDGDLSQVMETMSPTNKIRSRETGAAERRDIIPFSLAHLIDLCAFSACSLGQQREALHSRRGAPSVSQSFR